jgi:nickel-dependent lactate racemase
MRVTVHFQDESVELTVPDESLIGHWQGPEGISSSALVERLEFVLEEPTQIPPLRQAVVPGDRVAIALGADVPEPGPILTTLFSLLESCEVTPDSITIVTERNAHRDLALRLPDNAVLIHHDTDDRDQLAYLASTAEGRRVYLNRALTDADIVIPIGSFGYDPVLGEAGPWGVIYPGLSDSATIRDYQKLARDEPVQHDHPSQTLDESTEVSWLLGCQFQIGVVPAAAGIVDVVAGLTQGVRERGWNALDQAWTYRAESTSELVVVGVGRPGVPTGIDDVAHALREASRLVNRGGKIVALSRASGPIGPAVQAIASVDAPSQIAATLRKHEADPDHATAKTLARVLSWADVYLLSELDSRVLDDLGVIALERPREVSRLAGLARSFQVVSHADRVRAVLADDAVSARS